MQPDTHAWLDGLRASLRDRCGLVQDDADPATTAAERSILGAHLARWLDGVPTLLRERSAWAPTRGPDVDPDPAIVLTTSASGIDLAATLVGVDSPVAAQLRLRLVCATEREYRAWCMGHPDGRHRWHVNHWSWIKTRVPSRRDREFSRHPLGPGERYWLHRVGTVGSGPRDGRTTHLWKFDGRHAVLLEADVDEARVVPPRP